MIKDKINEGHNRYLSLTNLWEVVILGFITKCSTCTLMTSKRELISKH